MNITESNKLIAEFMGWKWEVRDHYGINIMRSPEGKSSDLKGMKFHKSWNWLIPVIQKIRKCKHYQNLDGLDYTLLCDLTIDNLYIEVVECIKEYNELNN